MELPIFQIDSFSDAVFKGNPAAVVPLQTWPEDGILQNIASENNLSETAFFTFDGGVYHIRWFTPKEEVALCGHATLAAAFVIFEYMDQSRQEVIFSSKSGDLKVSKAQEGLVMDFPIWDFSEISNDGRVKTALGIAPRQLYSGTYWTALLETEQQVRTLKPDYAEIAQITECEGLIVTALSENKDSDFVSRFFMPQCGINEDPVTGSAHCILTPLWAGKLGKNTLQARQISNRGGSLLCELKDGRVHITGQAVPYMKGCIYV